MGLGEYDTQVSGNDLSQRWLQKNYCGTVEIQWSARIGPQENPPAGRSNRPFSKAAGESKPEAYPQGYVEDFDEPRTKLADFFSALLRTTVGTCESLLKHRAEAEVGNGIFEVGVQPFEGSHVRVGDVFHR